MTTTKTTAKKTTKKAKTRKTKAARVEQIRKRGPAFLAQLDDDAVLAFARHERDVRKRRDADAAAALNEEIENAEFLAELGLEEGPQKVEPREMRLRDTASANGAEAALDAAPTNGAMVVPASQLSPELVVPPSAATHWYWVGLRPECPRAQINVPTSYGVVCVAKKIETIHRDKDTGKQTRIPRPGQFLRLTRQQAEAFGDEVAKRVLRIKAPPQDEDQGSGVDVGRRVSRSPRTHLCRITTEEEARARQEHAPAWRPYVPGPNDKHLADFIYVQFLEERPKHISIDTDLPDPISVTGIPLPPPDATPAIEGQPIARASGDLLR